MDASFVGGEAKAGSWRAELSLGLSQSAGDMGRRLAAVVARSSRVHCPLRLKLNTVSAWTVLHA